jgi:hypothetical protein
MTEHERHENREDHWGCAIAICACGWESAPTNRPQHLGRAYRSHKADAEKRAAKAAAKRAAA